MLLSCPILDVKQQLLPVQSLDAWLMHMRKLKRSQVHGIKQYTGVIPSNRCLQLDGVESRRLVMLKSDGDVIFRFVLKAYTHVHKVCLAHEYLQRWQHLRICGR